MTISRRLILQGLTASLSVAALGSWARPAAPSPTPVPSGSPFVRAPLDLTPTPPPGTGWVLGRKPLSLSASVSLSEDYFSTDQVVLGGPDDVVKPFTCAGQTGAVVLAGGVLALLWPEASAPSGWSYGQVPLPSGATGVDSVSVGTDADGTAYMLAALTGGQAQALWYLNPDTPAWTLVTTFDVAIDRTVRCCYGSRDSRLNFYVARSDNKVAWYTPDRSTAQVVVADPFTDPDAPEREDALIVPSGGNVGRLVDFEAFILIGGGFVPVPSTGVPAPPFWGRPADSIVSGGTFLSNQFFISYVYDDHPEALVSGFDVNYAGQFTGPVASQTIRPVVNPDGSSTLTVITIYGGQLYVAPVQWDPDNGPVVQPSIPIQSSVLSAAVSETGPLDGVFYVDASFGLNHLRRNPTTGAWQSFPIHQGGQSLTSVQMWRTELSVLDANGTPAPGVELTLTALGQLDLWSETTGTLLQEGGTATFTTNSHGRVTVTIPAEELSTAGFSVAADGLAPVVVAPDGEVHTYLSGTGTLNTLPAMSGGTLQAAKAADGTAVFPSSMTADTATAAAAAMGQALVAGQQAATSQAPAAGQTQSFSVDMSGGTATYSSSTRTADLGALLRGVGAPVHSVGSWWDKVKHDAESVYHGIRTGVIAVSHAAGTFVSEAEGWAMSLVIQIGDDVAQAIDLAVTDLRSAVHFVSSVFHALGADIDKALKWLRAEIIGLFTHTVIAADTLYGWMTSAQANLSPLITLVQNDVDTFFTQIKGDINSYLGSPTLTALGSQTLTTLGQPASVERARRPGPRPVGDPDPASPTGANSAHGNWLLHKVESLLPTMTSPYSGDLSDGFVQMTAKFADGAFDAVQADGLALWHALTDTLGDPKDLKTKGVGEILGALDQVAVSMLDLIQLVIDDLLQLAQDALDSLESLLTFTIGDIPIVGELLRLAGVRDDVPLGRLACLVAMFPAVLAKQVVTGNPEEELFDFSGTSAAKGRDGKRLSVTQATGLNYAAAALQGILTAFAVVDDLADEDDDFTPPNPLDYFSTVVPNILLAGLLVVSWPGNSDPRFADEPFSKPMPNGTNDERLAISVYAFSILEWVLNVGDAIETLSDLGTKRAAVQKSLKWLNSGLGLFLVVVGCTSAGVNKQGAATIAGQFLSEFTLMLTFLGDFDIIAASEDTSLPALMLLDFFCGAGAAVAFAAS